MLNLDTHILVAFFLNTLRADEDRTLAGQPWGISPVVLWELFDLVSRGRIRLDVDAGDFQRDLQRIPILALTVEVARLATRLDFHTDPVDEIIGATSIHYGAPLLTRDARILASRMVPLALA